MSGDGHAIHHVNGINVAASVCCPAAMLLRGGIIAPADADGLIGSLASFDGLRAVRDP